MQGLLKWGRMSSISSLNVRKVVCVCEREDRERGVCVFVCEREIVRERRFLGALKRENILKIILSCLFF